MLDKFRRFYCWKKPEDHAAGRLSGEAAPGEEDLL
jgi:hypothetical protein